MKKRITVLLIISLLSFFLFGCYSETDLDSYYDRGYESGFDAGVRAAAKSHANYLSENTYDCVEDAVDVLESYISGENIYTRNDAEEALSDISNYHEQVCEVYRDIHDNRVEVWR